MTSNQLAKFIAQYEEDAAILRKAQAILERHAKSQARATLPTKLQAATKLRAASSPYRNGTEHVLDLARQWDQIGKPISNRALREAGVSISPTGIGYALRHHGYRAKGRVWSKSQPRRNKRNGPPQKGDSTQALVAILREAGQPMRISELLASIRKAGGRASPQLIGSAMRQGVITRQGEKGPAALYGLPS